jgi:hypothetical protein
MHQNTKGLTFTSYYPRNIAAKLLTSFTMTPEMIFILLAAVAIATAILAGGGITRWVRQHKEYKMWLRLTDGQEATEL